jgi:hypothetical protein
LTCPSRDYTHFQRRAKTGIVTTKVTKKIFRQRREDAKRTNLSLRDFDALCERNSGA